MADIELDVNRTALLMADFHTEGMTENPMVQERHTLDRAREVLNIARRAGVFVAYIVVNFRSSPESHRGAPCSQPRRIDPRGGPAFANRAHHNETPG